ncbi:hypothetical protein ANACOL_00367 [Anaerotruncus colihominis DSM 17241]|uniref:Uncharacterized protein n=1 Tax=Anaerotruncus colihominis DSM 17241 TaxID=445972 RepID=B0P6J0_9FIRM|nr:hypothetical protein ANACOL_00367 [Anaerotruncus colihominis DSM 17241]
MEKRMDLRKSFLSGKEGKRGNPDGFQAFPTRSEREIFRQDMYVSHWCSS